MLLNKKNVLLLCAALSFLYGRSNDSLFTIANTLQNNMVVQQGKPLTVWGKAAPGTMVSVSGDWHPRRITTVASRSGIWTADIAVPQARRNEVREHSLTVSSAGKKLTLSGILFGDVWLCSGQSNMDMTVKPFLPWLLGAINYRSEIENARYPHIRLFDVETDFKAGPQTDCKGKWKICSPETAGDFSAAAYFFAREVYNRTGIPQGLITSTVGASSCQAWIGRDTLEADKILYEHYLLPYDTSARSREPLDATVTFEKVVRPTLFYNAMIHPLKNIQLRGALWYQGESNKDDGALYERLCTAMINNWRKLFRNDSLPFYYVQVAPYNWMQQDTTLWNYAPLREAQAKIEKNVSHAGMALTMDIADPNDIHPRNKQEVGYRLAKLALSETYRQNNICRGPEYEKHSVIGDTLIVYFQNRGSGLMTNDGLAPRHFYITGSDGNYHYARASIRDNAVYLYTPSVKKPVNVRYAFTNAAVTNLENAEGFPAIPFRTGERSATENESKK